MGDCVAVKIQSKHNTQGHAEKEEVGQRLHRPRGDRGK